MSTTNASPSGRSPWPGEPKRVLSVLVEERPDLLAQTVGLLQRRNFRSVAVNIGATEQSHVARLTLSFEGPESEAERLVRELSRLLYVLAVEDLSAAPSVVREMALLKVRVDAAHRAQISQLCEAFRARPVDVTPETVTLEITGAASKIEGFIAVLRPFGIAEMTRTSPIALARAEKTLQAEGPPSSWLERRRRQSAAAVS